MMFRDLLALIGIFDLLLLVGIVIYFPLKLGWIVQRFESTPDLLEHPLFLYPPPRVLKTVMYVSQVGGLEFFAPEWVIRRGIEKGRIPPGTSKAAVYGHFSAEELSAIRRACCVNLVWFGIFMAVGLMGFPYLFM